MQFVPVNKLSSHRESKDASEKLESSEGEFSSGEENRSRANFLCCSNFEGKIGKFHRFRTMEKISLAALLPPFTKNNLMQLYRFKNQEQLKGMMHGCCWWVDRRGRTEKGTGWCHVSYIHPDRISNEIPPCARADRQMNETPTTVEVGNKNTNKIAIYILYSPYNQFV